MNVKERLLHNWKAKLASLLVAIAVWYLFKEDIRTRDRGPIFSDPGVLSASVSASAAAISGGSVGGIPGMAIAGAIACSRDGAPVAWVVAERPQSLLRRLRWLELGAFSASVEEYPAHHCG